jgi:hypothetical protein
MAFAIRDRIAFAEEQPINSDESYNYLEVDSQAITNHT